MATRGADGSGQSPADPWAALEGDLVRALADALAARGVSATPEQVALQLDWSGSEHGDLAFPLHRAAKAVGRDPSELAREIAGAMPALAGLSPPRPVGAFLNVAAEPRDLAATTLRSIFERGPRYGHLDLAGARVCVEHTSANPTGPFHVGRVRNGIIGDTLTRVLRATGAPVTSQYYVDDVGRQAAMVTWIWSKPVAEWPEEIRAVLPAVDDPDERADRRLGRPYPAVSQYLKTHPEAAAEVQALSRALESGHPPARHHELVTKVLEGMLASLARVGIRFDELVWESRFLSSGEVDRVVERLAAAPHAVTEPNGAAAIDAGDYGLPKESARVIVARADGTTLYATRDVAYHLEKFGRFPRVIDVLGQDHHLHARTLEALLTEIGETRRPEFVIYQDITVPDSGGGRMSTRHGKAVYLDDLLDEAEIRARAEILARREDMAPDEVAQVARTIAASAVRYHILRVAPDKTVAFRWEDALSFEGRSGPFLQYSYARASSILRKADGDAGPWPFDVDRLATPPERALIKRLSLLPGVVARVARTTHVHALAGFAHQLAEEFNRFYESTPVIKAGEERASRLALVAAARQGLGNALDLLGLSPLERM